MEMKNAVTKGAITFFYHQKGKDTKQKLKEKVYLIKRKIKYVKEKLRRKSKISRIGNYVSIIVGLLLLLISWSAQSEWLMWLSTMSIFSNVLLLTIQKYSTLSKGS
jgi:hypothetical protein